MGKSLCWTCQRYNCWWTQSTAHVRPLPLSYERTSFAASWKERYSCVCTAVEHFVKNTATGRTPIPFVQKKFNEVIYNAYDPYEMNTFDFFDFCAMLRSAFLQTFTYLAISNSFRASGLFPVDPSRLLSVPHPYSTVDPKTIVSVEELERMFARKCTSARQRILGDNGTIAECRFLDTKEGAVLTSQSALRRAIQKESRQVTKKLEKQLAIEMRVVRFESKGHLRSFNVQNTTNTHHPRRMKYRRACARARTLERQLKSICHRRSISQPAATEIESAEALLSLESSFSAVRYLGHITSNFDMWSTWLNGRWVKLRELRFEFLQRAQTDYHMDVNRQV